MTKTNNLTKKSYVRFTGLMYLAVIIFAGFSQGYVRSTIVVQGDAATTATNIIQNVSLFRLGLTTDMIAFLLDAVISVMLYLIFKPFNKNLAMISSALRLIAHPAIGSMNLLNHFLALHVLGSADFMLSFAPEQLQSISMLFIEAHRNGYLIAGAFFGLHCFLLGIQIYKSNIFPKIFGVFMIGASAGYLLETFGNFNIPGFEEWTALIVGVTAALGEVSLTFYMIIKGVKQPKN